MTEEEIAHVAQAFVQARAVGRALPDYPGPMPATLDDAYRIQARAIAECRAPVRGWKVGRIAPPFDRSLGADRLVGPIFAVAESALPDVSIIAGGFAAIEAEFLFRIASLPTTDDYDPLAHIDAVHVGLELAGSPFARINAHGPCVTISDFGNNQGLVVGPPVPDWRLADPWSWPVTLAVDSNLVGSGRASDLLDGPAGSVGCLFAEARRHGLPIAPGQWISTGAITGVHPVTPGQKAEARFGSALSVSCHIVGRRQP